MQELAGIKGFISQQVGSGVKANAFLIYKQEYRLLLLNS